MSTKSDGTREMASYLRSRIFSSLLLFFSRPGLEGSRFRNKGDRGRPSDEETRKSEETKRLRNGHGPAFDFCVFASWQVHIAAREKKRRKRNWPADDTLRKKRKRPGQPVVVRAACLRRLKFSQLVGREQENAVRSLRTGGRVSESEKKTWRRKMRDDDKRHHRRCLLDCDQQKKRWKKRSLSPIPVIPVDFCRVAHMSSAGY